MTKAAVLLSSICLLAGSFAGNAASADVRPLTPAQKPAQHIQAQGSCLAGGCRHLVSERLISAGGSWEDREFWSRLSAYLNCCHPSGPRVLGYAYGPEVSLDYGSCQSRTCRHARLPSESFPMSGSLRQGGFSGR
jgi:hypothetical protein